MGESSKEERLLSVLEKKQLVKNFNKAANTYNGVAVLQKEVAEGLVDRLSLMKIDPKYILDAGSGTGFLARLLKNRFNKAQIVQLDIAIKMLNKSRVSGIKFFSKEHFVCADSQQLPLYAETFQLVCSNLMMQWCDKPDLVFSEIFRVLQPGSLFIFSTFGPETLSELRESWSRADAYTHVNNFVDMHDLGDALIRAGFLDPVMEQEQYTLTYDSGRALMADLKGLGARNVNTGRRHTLTGKGRIKSVFDALDNLRQDGIIPCSYEVVYGHAWMPEETVSRRIDEHTTVVPIKALKVNKR